MNNPNAPEQRTVDVNVEQMRTEGNTVHGHASVFNVLSEDLGGFRERIAPGAFTGVLDADVRLLVNHDPDRILARTKSGTLRMSQDDTGLAFEAELPTPPTPATCANRYSAATSTAPASGSWSVTRRGTATCARCAPSKSSTT